MVAIILVNYNGHNDTIKCIDSILLSDYTDYKIVVVDNSIDERSLTELSEKYKLKFVKHKLNDIGVSSVHSDINNKITILKSINNRGFAAANNLGIKYLEKYHTDIDYYWLLNNDTLIESTALTQLVCSAASLNDNIGIVGTRLLFMDSPNLIQALGGNYNKYIATCKHVGASMNKCKYREIINSSRIDYVIGASMFVKKQFVDVVGYMEEKYFLYFEELDWIKRGEKYGFNFKIDYNVDVYHKEGGSTKDASGLVSEIADVCQLRNRIIFTKKFYPKYLAIVLFATFLTITKRLLYGHIDRAKVLYKVYYVEVKNICLRRK